MLEKLTGERQVTIPKDVRGILGLERSDSVVLELRDDGQVTNRRGPTLDPDDLAAVPHTLGEWLSDDDEGARGAL